MKKTLLSIAIITALPFGARAENISGAMYTAPAAENTNHPAPITQAYAPYGRIDIDTADQEHIATTAYVKGAYNSAIAAVNKVSNQVNGDLERIDQNLSEKQGLLEISGNSFGNNYLGSDVNGVIGMERLIQFFEETGTNPEILNIVAGELDNEYIDAINSNGYGSYLMTMPEVLLSIALKLNQKRVDIYTTWDTNATTQVELSNVQ